MIGDPDMIVETLENLKRQADNLENQVFDIVIHTPGGGISLTEAWDLSPGQRQKLVKKITEYQEAKYGSTSEKYIVNQGQNYRPE